LKIEQQIAIGMEMNAKLLENYLNSWNNFRELYEVNKDTFLIRYEQRNPGVSTFDGDIARYFISFSSNQKLFWSVEF
jgi:dynein heavy chain